MCYAWHKRNTMKVCRQNHQYKISPFFYSSHTITGDVSLAETSQAAELFGSDGLIVTGTTTGDPTKPEHLTGLFLS